jgi:O-succinylbenzoic acid--CoA ligase
VLPPENVRAGELVAVAARPGPDWIPLLSDLWERGVAILPLDERLTARERVAIVARARPGLLLEGGAWRRLEDALPAEGLALVIHTSGVGGTPKLVELEPAAVAAAVSSSALALEATSSDRWLCCLPLAHVGGLLVLLRAVLLGAPVVVRERFDPRTVTNAEAEFTSLVPTMLRSLLDARIDLTRFRSILVGGASLREDLRERARAAGAPVVETYGLTETCGGVVYDGRPLSGTQVRVAADAEGAGGGGTEAGGTEGGGTEGGIELRGPTLMRGYRLDRAATANAFTTDGWLRTGDSGRIDERGRLGVDGRIDELITTGGEKVWPEEVESVLSSHPGVAEVAVASRPDAEWGRRVVAFVVPAHSNAPPSLDELREHAARTVARFKAPRELVLVNVLPRTVSGKVRRTALPGTPE